jgi:uncharacterized protein DUF4839
MAGEVKYEHKSVRAVRGTDGLVISKMHKDGWELVEQAPGTLRSTLTFRRPRKPVPWLLIGAVAAVLAVVAAGVAIGAAFSDEDVPAAPASTTAAAGKKPSAAPTGTAAKPAAPAVITAQNNRQFAALLKADSCDGANEDFATRYAGQTIAFDGSIVNVQSHGSATTRYDLLLGPGNKGPDTTAGPAFQYEDVNMLDLHLTGKKVPATVDEGDTFRFVATVGEFNPGQCLFGLDPVSTQVR